MTPEIQQWLDALRSGKYKQGRDCLRSTDDEFCCLGVACDLLAPNAWELRDYTYMESEWRHLDGNVHHLPLDLVNRFGFSVHFCYALEFRNDEGKTFAEIADYIEKHIASGLAFTASSTYGFEDDE